MRIETATIEAYAAALPAAEVAPPDPATELVAADHESRAAFFICLDAINFGSGWWPTIRKRPRHSGYFTIAAGLTERFQGAGPWPASVLRGLGPGDIAVALGQDPEHPLMSDYAASLRDVGEHVLADYGGRFAAVLEAAGGSAVALADLLAGWEAFADASTYDERRVPFYKRAQIAAADLDRAGVANLREVDRLTAFADNLVPHVLRVDEVLVYDLELAAAIDAGELLAPGSPAETEIRAGGIHAVELLCAELAATGRPTTPQALDYVLWFRGGAPAYKAVPRHRARSVFY